MLTNTLKKIIDRFKGYDFDTKYQALLPYQRNERNELIARRLLRYTRILKIASEHHHVYTITEDGIETTYTTPYTYDQAEVIWHRNNSIAGITCEETLVRLFKSWGLKSRRVPRSGKPKKTKRPSETVKPCDIRLTVDDQQVLIESKLRSDPKKLYDDIQINPQCYLVHHEGHSYYVLHQEAFKELLVNRVPPVIHKSSRGVKFYHELFTTTEDKQEFIDIVSLKQKTFDYCFFIRPNTFEFLLDRCIRY